MKYSILVVDDESAQRQFLSSVLNSSFFISSQLRTNAFLLSRCPCVSARVKNLIKKTKFALKRIYIILRK